MQRQVPPTAFIFQAPAPPHIGFPSQRDLFWKVFSYECAVFAEKESRVI